MEVVADTCWYIDVEKGRSDALTYLAQNAGTTFVLTEIVRAELYAGGRDARRIALLAGASGLYGIDEAVAREWGTAARHLRSTGQMVGANDLWIAAIALANGVPVLTRNPSDFNRVLGVHVEAY